MKKRAPWIVIGLCALWVLAGLRPPRDARDAWAVQQFGRLPVVSDGRFQPIDSLARNSLLQLREKQSLYLKDEKRSLSATEWLMEVMMNPEKADQRRAFHIDHPELKSLLSLPQKNRAAGEDGKHYTWLQLKPGIEELRKQAQAVPEEAAQRTPFQHAVVKLQGRVFLYMRLKNTLQPETTVDFQKEIATYLDVVAPGVAAIRAREEGKEYDEKAFDRVFEHVAKYDAMMRLEPPLLVPPHHPERSRDEWMRVGEALIEVARGDKLHPSVHHYAAMATAFQQERKADFAREVSEYQRWLGDKFRPELTKAGREHFFNHSQSFYRAMAIYLLVGLFAFAFWFAPAGGEWMRRTAMCLAVLALVIHTGGLLFRMLLEGRPPVTNLYSSAVFIGWGAAVLGLVLERFWKNSIGLVVSAVIGFTTLIIAHHLSLSGDTMVMMQAVLDTNFWLATHVVAITLGYASTFVAGFLAIIYLIRGVFTRTLTAATAKALSRMTYGIICFATLFSFVGTVLGGIWADQSWGRFWGWDPKENGALIIVLWNALILHARWGGMVRERGLMNMAIVGNIVTGWSWFGTNMLGVGLHSYGFTSAAFQWLMIFVASQLLFIGLGLLPQRYWLSLREAGERVPGPPSAARS